MKEDCQNEPHAAWKPVLAFSIQMTGFTDCLVDLIGCLLGN